MRDSPTLGGPMDTVCPLCGAELSDITLTTTCTSCGGALPAEMVERFEREKRDAERLSRPRAKRQPRKMGTPHRSPPSGNG